MGTTKRKTADRMRSRHFMVKLLRVDGGCLGTERR
jgi:hypothetical protein